MSRVIDGMSKDTIAQPRPLLNFYFEHGQSGKTLMMDMLRSFIEQLLQQDDAIVDDLHETVLPARPSDLRSIPWLEDIATRMILAQDQTPHLRDIENFSSSVLNQIKDRFPDLEEEEEMLQKLDPLSITQASKGTEYSRQRFSDTQVIANAAVGMFMYAKVVLDNFLSQTSVFELEQELEREYPRGLDEAYDRVAERVLDNTSRSRKQASLQILGLVACAARPLEWREIQCYFCIDAVNGTCDPRRRKVGPKDLCSSFVESEACPLLPNEASEAQIVMVHNTAKRSAIFSEIFFLAFTDQSLSQLPSPIGKARYASATFANEFILLSLPKKTRLLHK